MKDRVWACSRRGDCCRHPAGVLMTLQEAALIVGRRKGSEGLLWEATRPGFLTLKAQPCPLLNPDGSCSVYDIRPYVCRRFLCFRGDGEPFVEGGTMGCQTLELKVLTSRPHRRLYAQNQRHAARWARQHGWSGEEA